MTGGAARLGAALGTLAAFVTAVMRGGLTAWAAGALAVGGLVLVAAVLFVPSETPARRLVRLLQAWHNPTAGATGTEPGSGRYPARVLTRPAARRGSGARRDTGRGVPRAGRR